MTRKILAILSMILLSTAARGQGIEVQAVVSGGGVYAMVEVCDAATGVRLPGTHVRMLSATGDTIVVPADENGIATFRRGLRTDSIALIVTRVGYKPLARTLAIPGLSVYLRARIMEEALEMNAIIIRGDRIAMVVKGDTIIYNASSFKTMRGDPLEKLLEKLPGVELRDGTYRVHGEPVHMILVNGTEIFGHNTGAAADMIKSDQVVNVKTYDYHTLAQQERGDTLEQTAHRVLDVTTREQMTFMQQRSAGANAGAYTGNDKVAGSAGVASSHFSTERQRNASASIDENFTDAGKPAQQETRKWRGYFYTNEMDDKALPYMINSEASGTRLKNESAETGVYSASSATGERRVTATSSSINNDATARLGGSASGRIGKRNHLSLSIDGNYARVKSELTNVSVIETPALRVTSDARAITSERRGGGSASVHLSRPIGASGEQLRVIFTLADGGGKGSGEQLDTAATSTERAWIDRASDTRERRYTFQASLNGFSLRGVHVSATYDLAASRLLARQEGFDRLANHADTLSSYNRSSNEDSHQLLVNGYIRKGNTSLSVSLAGKTVAWKIDERAYPVNTLSRRFNTLMPGISFSHETPLFQVWVNYGETPVPLNPADTREIIDRSDPLYLRVGNRSLQQGLERRIHARGNFTFVKAASSVQFDITGSTVSSQVTTRKYFFERDTFLARYNYPVKAGTSLEVKENIDGKRSARVLVQYSSYMAFMESTINGNIIYNYDRSPYFYTDRQDVTRSNRWSFVAGVNTGFSRVVQFTLSSSTAWERSANAAYRVRSVSENLSGTARANFAKRFWLHGSGSFYLFDSSMPGSFRREVILDASLSCKFGKEDRGEVGLRANDLLNRQRSTVVSMTEDYASTRSTGVLGRSAYVFATYTF
jgi:hypothetical protein